MTKRQMLDDPNSCFNRARDDEEMFVLLGRDIAAPEAIRQWAEERIYLEKNKPGDPQIVDAEQCAKEMERQQSVKTVYPV